jgi:Fe-S-cluster-containing dehydrogenase component
VLACPFGVPKLMVEMNQMMKCDMCFDRTSVDLAPMCASVCPSQALWFGTRAEFADSRPGVLIDEFAFGRQTVRTKVLAVAREDGPIDVLRGREARAWQDDPFGLEEEGVDG